MSSGWGTYKDDLEAGTVSFTVPFLLLLFDVYVFTVFQEYGIQTVQW